jgi:NADH-quinone oxidoreductase subunit H
MLNALICFVFTALNAIIIILFILLGGILPLIERKFLSLTHRRVGPKFAGFKGRFQFIADAIKLLIKEFFLPKTISKFFFFLTPIFLLNVNLFLVLNIV